MFIVLEVREYVHAPVTITGRNPSGFTSMFLCKLMLMMLLSTTLQQKTGGTHIEYCNCYKQHALNDTVTLFVIITNNSSLCVVTSGGLTPRLHQTQKCVSRNIFKKVYSEF